MKWLHNLMKGASLTGALFVFQACYGMPQDPKYFEYGEAPMSFSLLSHTTGEPLEGIRVMGRSTKGDSYQELGTTGADGNCHVSIPYFRNQEGPFLMFEDPKGRFASKDTSFADLRERNIPIKLYPIQ
ncbi:MAG: hypothetical protein II874_05655 [Bacteroidales bacterium]|nr:hypothetical protein [Bacteroidales bacterium]